MSTCLIHFEAHCTCNNDKSDSIFTKITAVTIRYIKICQNLPYVYSLGDLDGRQRIEESRDVVIEVHDCYIDHRKACNERELAPDPPMERENLLDREEAPPSEALTISECQGLLSKSSSANVLTSPVSATRKD
jgi:hypothetical protein